MKRKLIFTICLILTGILVLFTFSQCGNKKAENLKPRILISSDIGGTDPDDMQSMIHLLMYSDLFQIEGLVASPYGKGRVRDILDMIYLYEKDFGQLTKHSSIFPEPDYLRSITKQGAISASPYKGYSSPSEGSDWIIKCAEKNRDQPLWILVWGGLDDLAQALHDDPGIKEKVKVYWIGGPNKKWSVNTYAYIAENHPDLWMIEANASYRGWFIDSESPSRIANDAYYDNYIQGRGALGKAFKGYYHGNIKMGDSPSLAYVMNGDPDDPSGESWGGSFIRIQHSSRSVFTRNTTTADTVVAYATLEWHFKGPVLDIHEDSVCFTMEISKQSWPGYYLGNGLYGVRYTSKKPETCTYLSSSSIPELDGKTGQFVSITPWPGKPGINDYTLGDNWYSDRPEPEQFLGVQQGAKTVSKYREDFLLDWADRWKWIY